MTGKRTSRRSRFFLTLIFFLSSLLARVFAQTTPSALAPIASALQQKDFAQALALLQPQLRLSPGNAELWAMQGTAYAGQGLRAQALDAFHHALKIAPDYIPALQGEVQIEYEAGHPTAIPVLKHLLRLQPANQTTHGMLAILEYQQGDFADAALHFEKAADLFDSRVDALHAYGVCLVKLKQFDRAAQVFQRSLALAPTDTRERTLLASIQLMAHQPEAAIATLAPSLASPNPDAGTLELASAAYEEAHDTDRAVEVLRQAILLEPANVNLYLDFANLSSVHQSFQVGINVVNDGLALQPKAAPLYFARGVLYAQLDDYDKAQADFDTAYTLDPNQSLSTAAQGLAAVQHNDLDHALATVQEKLVHKPADPILLYLQADILGQKGAEPGTPDFQTAMSSAKKAVSLSPALGPARTVLAKLDLQAGLYSEAATQCRKALDINPDDQTALYHLIQALRKSNRPKDIPELLKRLARLRQDATKEERQRYRVKLVEGDAPQ